MKHHGLGSFYILMLFSSFLLLFCSQRSSAQEIEDEIEFDYAKGSPKGPEKWGSLKKEWSVCKNGKTQSPIDITSKRVVITPKLSRLRTTYKPCNATIKNRGHDIAVEWEGRDAGWFRTRRAQYKLMQAHWHSPSEHTIYGKRYDMELHMVHKTDDPKAKHHIAVISLLYAIGQPDPFLSELLNNVTNLDNDHDDKEHPGTYKVVDPNDINLNRMKYYRYIGSLTVPPCTENVLWTIIYGVKTVSKAQLEYLKEAVHDFAENNARPVQPLNGRQIYSTPPIGRSK